MKESERERNEDHHTNIYAASLSRITLCIIIAAHIQSSSCNSNNHVDPCSKHTCAYIDRPNTGTNCKPSIYDDVLQMKAGTSVRVFGMCGWVKKGWVMVDLYCAKKDIDKSRVVVGGRGSIFTGKAAVHGRYGTGSRGMRDNQRQERPVCAQHQENGYLGYQRIHHPIEAFSPT